MEVNVMNTDANFKVQLPLAPSPQIMELLIKAKHFYEHATTHARTGASFDAMIAIHSLDNSIEYLLRILIKHLEIEENTGKKINTSELMGLFGEIDKYLSQYAIVDGKRVRLPLGNELKQLRELRNNVQHGLILPINELKTVLDYGERFFNKVLMKIFGLKPQEIAYSTLIENVDIKKYLIIAETKIVEGDFLSAIVACRDAFEMSKFLFRQDLHYYSKMALLPYLKKESERLYWYIQSLEQEIAVLGTNINQSDYRLYQRYIDHIPGEYRAEKSGYLIMQREWEKKDADFCYAFVSQIVLYWQITQDKPLYEVDTSNNDRNLRNIKIAGVCITEHYPEKSCAYVMADNTVGELIFVDNNTKEMLETKLCNRICVVENKVISQRNGLCFSDYKEYVIIDACEFNVILNNYPLWEVAIFYRPIPFTNISAMDEQINIDCISKYVPRNETEEKFKNIVEKFGIIDTEERAFELYNLLIEEGIDSVDTKGFFSYQLIDELGKTELI